MSTAGRADHACAGGRVPGPIWPRRGACRGACSLLLPRPMPLRKVTYGSAWFAHRDDAGSVTHIEIRGPDFRGALRGGTKTLFRLPGGEEFLHQAGGKRGRHQCPQPRCHRGFAAGHAPCGDGRRDSIRDGPVYCPSADPTRGGQACAGRGDRRRSRRGTPCSPPGRDSRRGGSRVPAAHAADRRRRLERRSASTEGADMTTTLASPGTRIDTVAHRSWL